MTSVVLDARKTSIARISGAEIGCPDSFVELTGVEYDTIQLSPEDHATLRLVSATIHGRGSGTSGPSFGLCDVKVDFKAFCLTSDPDRCQQPPQLNFELVGPCGPHFEEGVIEAGNVAHVWGDCNPNIFYFDVNFWGIDDATLSLKLWWGIVPDADEGRSVSYRIFVYMEGVNGGIERTFDEPLRLDDGMEENDASTQPRSLQSGATFRTFPNLLIAHEDDWYLQFRGIATSMMVTVYFNQEWGDLDLCVYTDTDVLVACSHSSIPSYAIESESVSTPPSTGGGWKVRVYGNPSTVINIYDMDIVLVGGGGGGGGGCKCYMLSTRGNVTRTSATLLQFEVGLGFNDSESLTTTYVEYSINSGTSASQQMVLLSGSNVWGYWGATVTVPTSSGDTVYYWFRGDGSNQIAFVHGPRSAVVQGGGASSLG